MIDHLSPAHANAFLCRRSSWWRRYVLRQQETVGAKAHRGTAVEAGIHRALTEDGMEHAIDYAMSLYAEAAAECEDAADVALDIPRLIEAGVATMGELVAEHGPVAGYQRKLTAKLLPNGFDWLGYTDFTMTDGTIIDLKVSGRSVSDISSEWARAGAFYHHASGGAAVKFLALTPLKKEVKAAVLTANMHGPHLDMLRQIERDVSRVLRLIDAAGPDAVAACFAPNPDDYWNKDAA